MQKPKPVPGLEPVPERLQYPDPVPETEKTEAKKPKLQNRSPASSKAERAKKRASDEAKACARASAKASAGAKSPMLSLRFAVVVKILVLEAKIPEFQICLCWISAGPKQKIVY